MYKVSVRTFLILALLWFIMITLSYPESLELFRFYFNSRHEGKILLFSLESQIFSLRPCTVRAPVRISHACVVWRAEGRGAPWP